MLHPGNIRKPPILIKARLPTRNPQTRPPKPAGKFHIRAHSNTNQPNSITTTSLTFRLCQPNNKFSTSNSIPQMCSMAAPSSASRCQLPCVKHWSTNTATSHLGNSHTLLSWLTRSILWISSILLWVERSITSTIIEGMILEEIWLELGRSLKE